MSLGKEAVGRLALGEGTGPSSSFAYGYGSAQATSAAIKAAAGSTVGVGYAQTPGVIILGYTGLAVGTSAVNAVSNSLYKNTPRIFIQEELRTISIHQENRVAIIPQDNRVYDIGLERRSKITENRKRVG